MRKWSWLAVLMVAGCSKEAANEPTVVEPTAVVVEQRPIAPLGAGPMLRPFKEVIVSEVPEGEQRPPDTTVTGQVVGKLYEQVAVLFDQVKFTDARGRKIKYVAVLKTDLGDLRLELLGDSAPNHVRNFIALARAGYYDGLPFHASVRRKVDDKTEAFIEAGCPLGSGELGYGSIGYWLKAEPSAELIHEEGIVGAYHRLAPRGDQLEDLDNAACKFYVSLSKAPWRDQSFTIFGKVIQGLDTAHTINQRPNQSERGFEDRPFQPVVIRQVLIEEVVAGGSQIALDR